jgi:hypothetical protein
MHINWKVVFWLNNMYVLTKGQSNKWRGYVLINKFDYDD